MRWYTFYMFRGKMPLFPRLEGTCKNTQDLEKDFNDFKEAYSKGDVIKGLRLLAGIVSEYAGLLTLFITFIVGVNIITGGLGGLGIPISVVVVAKALQPAMEQIGEGYSNLDKEDRRAVIAALKFLGIGPGSLIK